MQPNFELTTLARAILATLAVSATAISMAAPAHAEVIGRFMENNTDRPGSDYRRLELVAPDPETCQRACNGQGNRCKAWTYVRPGVQAAKAVCYLKSAQPDAQANGCCISNKKFMRLGKLPAANSGTGTENGTDQAPEEDSTPDASPAQRCRTGFVPRLARPSDLVCVPSESRTLVGHENDVAPTRWDPLGGYGEFTCISGFVWREAFDGDVTCVTPERRAAVKEENRVGPSRTE
jgi:hypothetical protein